MKTNYQKLEEAAKLISEVGRAEVVLYVSRDCYTDIDNTIREQFYVLPQNNRVAGFTSGVCNFILKIDETGKNENQDL